MSYTLRSCQKDAERKQGCYVDKFMYGEQIIIFASYPFNEWQICVSIISSESRESRADSLTINQYIML